MFLLSEWEGRTGNIWLVVTTHAVFGPHGPTRLACQYAFHIGTAFFLVLPFFLHIFILASHGGIRWAVRLFPTLLEPLRTFLIPGFFYVIRTHKNQDQ